MKRALPLLVLPFLLAACDRPTLPRLLKHCPDFDIYRDNQDDTNWIWEGSATWTRVDAYADLNQLCGVSRREFVRQPTPQSK